jgi:hypothetical protein
VVPVGDLDRIARNVEFTGCLNPATPYTQGPDPDDTPVPCGECPVCELVRDNERLRGALREIAITGGSSDAEINVSCHLHIKCAAIARTALDALGGDR